MRKRRRARCIEPLSKGLHCPVMFGGWSELSDIRSLITSCRDVIDLAERQW